MAHISKEKPWSVSDFEINRPHLTDFIRNRVLTLLEEDECRRIVIRAPVKSGKREMVEYAAMRDSTSNPHRVHVFLSAWHRVADDDQREELSKHNMKVFSIINKKKVDECLAWITQQVTKGKQIIAHLDECDHGSGQKQMLSRVWLAIHQNPKVTTLLYSATPEEVLFSGEVDDEEYLVMMDEIKEGHFVRYDPPEGYCGPKKFLSEGLITEAIPFFYKEDGYVLSQQAKDIIRDLRWNMATDPNLNIVILRLSYCDLGGVTTERKKNKAIYQFLQNIHAFPELSDFDDIIVDKGDDIGIRSSRFSIEKIQWSDPKYWRRQATGRPRLIIIDQTSSRSTEWACHDRIFATHDFRNVVQFSTISQAQERVNHYTQRYGEFQPIRVYGHKNTFLLSAGQIDYKVYLNPPWHKKKVDRRTAGDVELFNIKSTAAGHAVHPSYPTPLSSIAADRALQALGCYADVSVSARVSGRIVDKPIFTSVWRPVTPETWDTVWAAWQADTANTMPVADGCRVSTRNPFEAARPHRLPNGDWQGYHRCWSKGQNRRLDYDTDIVGDEGWGVKDGRRLKI